MRGLALALSSVAVERFGAEALLEAARRAGGGVERAQTSVTFLLLGRLCEAHQSMMSMSLGRNAATMRALEHFRTSE